MGIKPRPSPNCWWVVWGPAVKGWGVGRVYFTDTLCCVDFEVLYCLLVVRLLLTVFLAMSVHFLTLDHQHNYYCQTETRKNLPEKNPVGKKSQLEILIGTMAQTLNSPSHEATNFKRVDPR